MKQPQMQTQSSEASSSEVDNPFGTDESADDDEPQCAGGLPDLDPDAEPACSVQESALVLRLAQAQVIHQRVHK